MISRYNLTIFKPSYAIGEQSVFFNKKKICLLKNVENYIGENNSQNNGHFTLFENAYIYESASSNMNLIKSKL